MSNQRVLVVTDPHHLGHVPPEGHPEHPASPARVGAVRAAVDRTTGIEIAAGRAAERHELERVHEAAHIARIQAMSEAGGGWIDADTYVSSGTYDAACFAAGAGLVAIEMLLADPSLSAAFVVTRPPGHHATAGDGGGFCIFNNIAVAAAQLLSQGARVVIVDWDAHHGNGTQDIFWDERNVLYFSIHQEMVYPGSGLPHERGPAPENLTTVNLPLPAGATGDHYLTLLDDIATPLVRSFEPHWVLVSCGFDAHLDDPLAEMALGADDFGLFASRAQSWAPQPGRTVLFLEGGYHLGALEASTAAVLRALTGREGPSPSPTTGGPGATRVSELQRLWGPT